MKPTASPKPAKRRVDPSIKAKADRAEKRAKGEKVDPETGPLSPPEKKPIGRPSGYSAELGQKICDLVAMRIPVWAICEMDGMPSKDTLYRWKREIIEFSDNYVRAREHRADARQDYIDEVLRDAQNGIIDPQVARLIVDTEKWQMGKEKPKSYGDKVALTDADGGKLVIEFAT
ncbi:MULTISPECIES: ubiquitin carboxyl-hydrolase [Rhodomicrobium]|uniref:terminase small subunit-like protein n=1 Tax=Rhodomicrobium TaxID=1068 RepID=UPI000B4B125B|nr:MULTISPECIES: ubiquitin carboxyl-hydrolase [Rhodomicrobium]